MSDQVDLPLPGLRTAFVEQLRVVGLAVRREALLLAAVLFVVGMLVLIDMWQDGGVVTAEPMPPLMMIVLGALSPFAVWKGERVFGGGHIWSLPVARRRHALIKVLAGGVWLVVTVAAIQLWLMAMALATGGSLAEHETRMLVGPGGVTDLRPVQWTTQAWEWATPFTTALTCYLIGSTFMLAVKYPLRWGTAAVATFIALNLLTEEGFTFGVVDSLLDAVVMGPVGMDAALGGGLEQETTQPTGGRDVLGPELLVLWYRLPSFEHWAPAAFVWLVGAALAVWLAASRHRET